MFSFLRLILLAELPWLWSKLEVIRWDRENLEGEWNI